MIVPVITLCAIIPHHHRRRRRRRHRHHRHHRPSPLTICNLPCPFHNSLSNIVKHHHRSSPHIVCQLSVNISRLSQYQWATLDLQPTLVAAVNISYNRLSSLSNQPSAAVTKMLLSLPECSKWVGDFQSTNSFMCSRPCFLSACACRGC